MAAWARLQEQIDRFNEDEAVWRSFRKARDLRRRFVSRSPLSEKTLECIEWQEAERKHKSLSCIGRRFDGLSVENSKP